MEGTGYMEIGSRDEDRIRPLMVQPSIDRRAPLASVEGSGADAEVDRTIRVGSVAGLRSMRQNLATWLDDLGIGLESFVSDVQLAVVEVVTNAFIHGLADAVAVTVAIENKEVIVNAVHRTANTATVFPAVQPPADSISGRGLFIVDQVVRERTVSYSGGAKTTRLAITVPPELRPDMRLVGASHECA